MSFGSALLKFINKTHSLLPLTAVSIPSTNDGCLDRTTLSSLIAFLSYLYMADEEPVDQKKYFEDSCKPKCVRAWLEYQGCVKRVEADETGHKHCTGQYFDYWHCVDKCVAPKLFEKLK
uniref:Complex III subunit VI n=2 Tax=Helianthus annuus TaxID=4232 RepID=A0A251TAA3_HELAN